MECKYLMLLLAVSYTQNMVSSHILTSSYGDTSVAACKRSLMNSVINDLCPVYGDFSEEVPLSHIAAEIAKIKDDHREKLLEKCCNKPCTLFELMAIC